jgi:uncharacterized RDD family membrane protein YckC
MNENPYQPSAESGSVAGSDRQLQWAGFGARLGAYLIDVLPITFAIAIFYYFFMGFDATWERYNNSPGDMNARVSFLSQRNQIRDLSFTVYILYGAITECSALQGTIGKKLLGLRVTDNDGQQLTIGRSFVRNLAKIISFLPLGLGFLWAIWSKRKRGWHDIIAKTLVVKSSWRNTLGDRTKR